MAHILDDRWPLRLAVGCVLAAMMARRGLRKRSLSPSGAAAAFCVGVLTMQVSYTFGILLIMFYLTSSKLTKLQQEYKQQLEECFKKDGQRTALQVLSNSFGGVVAAGACQCAPLLAADPQEAAALRWASTVAYLAHYSAVCADTWASEVGILSRSPPRLITNWRRAPPGTNGAVSPLGCACSAAAGLFMGISFWALGAALGDVALVPARGVASSSAAAGDSGGGKGAALAAGACWAAAGLAAGVAGSLVDSLLGATVQFSGVDPKSGKVVGRPGPGVRRVSGRPWLSNDEVNAAAAAITSLGAAALAWRMVR